MTKKKHKILQPPAGIGIVGGGQLGRMITAEAKRMGYKVTILDPSPFATAGQMADRQITASFTDRAAIERLAAECDVITFEFEHIDADLLIGLEEAGYRVLPSGKTLKRIQDKYVQKTLLKNAGIPVPEFAEISSRQDMEDCIGTLGLPFVLKTRSGGYDGKGNCIIKSNDQIGKAWEDFKGYDLMAEGFVEFELELSIIAARDLEGNCSFYPIVENIHEDSILRITKAPSNIDNSIQKKVRDVARKVVQVLDDYGVFCIEMFLTRKGEIYINEIAPRPHNSGHYTIEACITSQFEQLVRIVTGMPLGSTRQRYPSAMVNILGSETVEGQYSFEGVQYVLGEEDTHLHLYGKQSTKKMKKIGHITVLDESIEAAEKKAWKALESIVIKSL